MSESMRGNRLGATSYEVDKGISAARQLTTYVCPQAHHTTVPFALEADEIPDTWRCACGLMGTRWGQAMHEQPVARQTRSHWDMLLERRSIAELEALLKERLDLIRGSEKRSA